MSLLSDQKKLGERYTPEIKRERFRRDLVRWHLPVSAYQVLEVLFRQCLMKHMPSVSYANDALDERLFNKTLSPKERVSICEENIRSWQLRTNTLNLGFAFQFGFENLYPGGFFTLYLQDQDRNAIEEIYSSALLAMQRYMDGAIPKGDYQANFAISELARFQVFANSLTQRFLESKRKNFVGSSEVKKGTKRGKPYLKIQANKFFADYIGIADGIFGKYFTKISTFRGLKANNLSVNTNTNAFIATKMNHEFDWYKQWKPYKARTIHDRIKGNQEGYERRRTIPIELGLINDEFMTYLFGIEGMISRDAA